MIAKTKVRLLSVEEKEFKNEGTGHMVKFVETYFCDDEGNKFRASAHQNIKDKLLKLDIKSGEATVVDADLDFTVSPTKNGGTAIKVKLIDFTLESK